MNEKMDMKELAIKLHKLGYHIVPVDKEKKPLAKWKERLTLEELEKTIEKAHGIALVCGRNHPLGDQYTLISIDVDNPTLLGFSITLQKLLKETIHVLTGPRCPLCGEKSIEIVEEGRKFKCPGCNIEFEIERASRGLAVFIFVENSIASKYFGGTKREYKDVEFLINNYQLIAGKHPTGIEYELRKLNLNSPDLGITIISENDLIELLNEIEKYKELKSRTEKKERIGKKEKEETKELRILKEEEINQAIALLKDVYKPGVRQNIWLYFSGWCAKAGIHYLSTTKVLFSLYKDCIDTDNLKMRLATIVYSYEKIGIKIDKQKIKEITGEEPYGPETIVEEEIKGKSGLYEIFVNILGNEEEAMDRIRKLEEILGPSPFGDLIMKIIDHEKKMFAIADLRKLRIVTGKLIEEDGRSKLKLKEEIVVGTITDLKVIVNPLYNLIKYTFKFKHPQLGEKFFGPVTSKEFVDWLKTNSFVISNRKAEDVINAIINGFIKKGLAEIKTEVEEPGFYVIGNGGLLIPITVGYELRLPSKEEVKEALFFLDYIRKEYYSHAEEVFLTVLKWCLIAPFNNIVKNLYKTYIPALYVYGPQNTGKSSMFLIAYGLYRFRYPELSEKEVEIPGSSVNTEATLGKWLSKGTFPVCIKEPYSIFQNESLSEMLKSAIEGTIARGRFRGGLYTIIPSLAPLAFTSNYGIPTREGFIGKRIYLIRLTMKEMLDTSNPIIVEKIQRFETEVKTNLWKLSPIFDYVAYYIIHEKNFEILKNAGWLINGWLSVSEELLKKCFEYAGLEVPEWIYKRCESATTENFVEETMNEVRNYWFEEINNAFKAMARKEDYSSSGELKSRLEVVGQNEYLPWLIVKGNIVYITKDMEKDFERKKKISVDLKSIAEYFGFEYKKESIKVKGKVINKYFLKTNIEDFVRIISPKHKIEEIEQNQPSQTNDQTQPQTLV